MKRITVIILVLIMLLVGCSSGGPSNKEAKEVIFGVYFQDVNIVQKKQCELTTRMQEEGQYNIWFIRYKFKDSGKEGGMLLSESDSVEYPWQVYGTMVNGCPN